MNKSEEAFKLEYRLNIHISIQDKPNYTIE